MIEFCLGPSATRIVFGNHRYYGCGARDLSGKPGNEIVARVDVAGIQKNAETTALQFFHEGVDKCLVATRIAYE